MAEEATCAEDAWLTPPDEEDVDDEVEGADVAPREDKPGPEVTPPEELEEEEDEEEAATDNEDDEADEEDDDDGAVAEPVHATTATSSSDWIPEWAPFAVLGLLVTGSILIGLGLIGGGGASEGGEDEAAPSGSVVAPAKPSPHP